MLGCGDIREGGARRPAAPLRRWRVLTRRFQSHVPLSKLGDAAGVAFRLGQWQHPDMTTPTLRVAALELRLADHVPCS